jgi:glycosyltransferase involved in cell wall biosynthesis
MRIVYVLTSLGMGGAERQVLALATRMVDRGHAVALLVLRPPLPEQWPTSIEVHHLDIRKTPGSVLLGLANAHRFLRTFRPDLLHSHSFHANMIARALKLLHPAFVSISTVHNVYEGGWPRMLAYRLTDVLSRRTTAVSQAAADRFIHIRAVPHQKCIVLTNGIDTEEFLPNANRREQMRSAMSANSDFTWLTAGRIAPAKDYPNLLRAFAQVWASQPKAYLWIAGEAAANALAADLRALASELGIADSVRWLGLRRDLPALLDAADGFVLASAWEGMPLALGEAMAMQKPVVATEVGGVRELAGDSAALVSPADSQALAGAMLNVMRMSADDRRSQGRAARTRIETQFSMDSKASEWEALYGTVLGCDRSSTH